jgi:hypothetical protein
VWAADASARSSSYGITQACSPLTHPLDSSCRGITRRARHSLIRSITVLRCNRTACLPLTHPLAHPLVRSHSRLATHSSCHSITQRAHRSLIRLIILSRLRSALATHSSALSSSHAIVHRAHRWRQLLVTKVQIAKVMWQPATILLAEGVVFCESIDLSA